MQNRWHGADLDYIADNYLITPPLQVSNAPGVPFVLTVSHSFSFEVTGGVRYDGGVIEVSTNGGGAWVDASTFASPGYNGAVYSGSNSPLHGRPAFVGTNASWPSPDTLVVNFGATLAGKLSFSKER